MKNYFGTISVILTLVFCMAGTAIAQEQFGNIEGTVRDQQGAVVPNVTVTIVNKASGTGFRREVNTNNDGFFRVLQVPPGVYTVSTAATSGFSAATYDNVNVTVGNTVPVDIGLAIGSAPVTVDVNATDNLPIDPSGSKVQTNISTQQIELLPKTANFTGVLRAVPGTRQEANSGGFQIDGASGSENSFTIDGQEVNNFRTGAMRSNQNLPTQFVSEVSVKSSGFEAEFGGATGGVINVITKGGSNDWHGEFGSAFTSNKLDGKSRPSLLRFTNGADGSFVQKSEYQTFPKAGEHSFLPTANLGGPIIKNKIWFFGSYTPQIVSETRDVAFFNNAPSSGSGFAARTYRFNEEYRRKIRNEFAYGRIDASLWSTLRINGTYTWNPVATTGALPFGMVSFGGVPPSVDFGGSIGRLTGNQLTDRQGGRETANNLSTQAVWTPTNNVIVSGRYSRGFANEKGANYFAVLNTQFICNAGAVANPDACIQGANDPTNGAVIKDISIRTNYSGDATFVVGNFGGRHEFKGGYSWLRLENDVLNGYASLGRVQLWYDGSTITDRGSTATPTAGAIGSGTLTRIGTSGQGANTSQQIFIQDKWQPTRRLTLNLGVRFEKEDLPSFNGFAPPINFSFGEKIVPRLGAAYDLTGDGKTKLFGSYSEFSDRMRFDLPRGSFGGDFFRVDYFEIFPNSGPFRNFTLANILGNFNDAPGGACPATGFIGSGLSRCQADFRIASNNPEATLEDGKVDPNMKPFRQAEITIGFQRQLTDDYRLSTRYVYKNVLSAVEDAGVRNAAGSEAYILGNPGIGLHREQLDLLGYIKGAKPKRRYDAIEVVLDKRLANRYYYSLNYTYSRLYGNYSGLASSDEAGRTSPGVNRFFDLPHLGFTATGEPDDGRLATDRPHVFNAYGAYLFDWMGSKSNETTLSFFQTFQSGTPQSSTVGFYTTSIFTKRGDLGRTPLLSQTDLSFTHKYKFGRDNRFAVAADLNIINAWDQDTVMGLNTSVSAVTLTDSTFRNSASISPGIINTLDCPTPIPGSGMPAIACPRIFASPVAATNAYTSGQILDLINRYLDGTPGQATIPGLPGYRILPALNRRNSSYGMANAYQNPRAIRFGFRFIF